MGGLLELILGRRKNTASVAKDRLQIILAHEHAQRNAPDFLPALQQEILEVIAKYVQIDTEAVNIQLGREGDYEVLEVNVPLSDEIIEQAGSKR
jgi:cell division topological specificity factor